MRAMNADNMDDVCRAMQRLIVRHGLYSVDVRCDGRVEIRVIGGQIIRADVHDGSDLPLPGDAMKNEGVR